MATRDLINILDYIENDLKSIKACEDLSIKIFDVIKKAIDFPKMGKEIDNKYIFEKNIRQLIVDNYKILYTIESETNNILIICIMYAKMSIESIMNKLQNYYNN